MQKSEKETSKSSNEGNYLEIVYPIFEKNEDGRVVKIKAGKSWTDENRIKKYEGIEFKIPKEISDNKVTTFVVLRITKKDYDNYILNLHSHDFDVDNLKEHYEISQKDEFCMIDAGGDIEVTLTVKKDLLANWMGLSSRDIRLGYERTDLGATYNLLSSLPRKILVKQNEVIIVIPKNQKIDSSNVCNYILEDRHPLDWKEEKQESELENLKKQLHENKKLAEERLNHLKYLQADFDNYRKKFDKEKEQIIRLANENLIKELIIVLDDFDAAIKLSAEEENKKGLLTLKKKFFDILVNQGLKEIEALGRKFNPEFHEVLCKELSKHNEDKIIEEIQKGYLLREKVIRASKVKVSKNDEKKNLKMEDDDKEING